MEDVCAVTDGDGDKLSSPCSSLVMHKCERRCRDRATRCYLFNIKSGSGRIRLSGDLFYFADFVRNIS